MKPCHSVGGLDVSVQQSECLSDAIDSFSYFLAEERSDDGGECVEINAECINHVLQFLSQFLDGELHALDDFFLA